MQQAQDYPTMFSHNYIDSTSLGALRLDEIMDESRTSKTKKSYSEKLIDIFEDELVLDVNLLREWHLSESEKLEDSPFFKQIAEYYISAYSTLYDEKINRTTLLENHKITEDFYHYILTQSFRGSIVIPPESQTQRYYLLTDFQTRYIKNINVPVYQENHEEELEYQSIWAEGLPQDTESQVYTKIFNKTPGAELEYKEKEQLNKVKTAYSLMKRTFQDQKRKELITGTKFNKNSFSHIEGVMNIVLSWKYGKPTIDRLLIALLHDAIEDIDWFSKEHIATIFNWDAHVADCVEQITKKPRQSFLSEREKDILSVTDKSKETYKTIKKWAKEKRNKEYFSRFLKQWIQKDVIFVKICDRIHNMTFMDDCSTSHKLRKAEETEKHFLNVDKFRDEENLQEAKKELEKLVIKQRDEANKEVEIKKMKH